MKANHIKLRRFRRNTWELTFLWPNTGTTRLLFNRFDGAIAYLMILELGGAI